jgi:hypothetical protein
MEKKMLKIMHIIENNRINHSEMLFFIFISQFVDNMIFDFSRNTSNREIFYFKKILLACGTKGPSTVLE